MNENRRVQIFTKDLLIYLCTGFPASGSYTLPLREILELGQETGTGNRIVFHGRVKALLTKHYFVINFILRELII